MFLSESDIKEADVRQRQLLGVLVSGPSCPGGLLDEWGAQALDAAILADNTVTLLFLLQRARLAPSEWLFAHLLAVGAHALLFVISYRLAHDSPCMWGRPAKLEECVLLCQFCSLFPLAQAHMCANVQTCMALCPIFFSNCRRSHGRSAGSWGLRH